MHDYKQKYLKYKKKYIILKLGGSKDEKKVENRNKLLNNILNKDEVVSSFIKKYKNINDLLLDSNNINKIKIQKSTNDIYIKLGTLNGFWNILNSNIKFFLKQSRTGNKDSEEFTIHTITIENMKYLINEVDLYNNIILSELKKIYLLESLNKIKQEKEYNKKKELKKNLKELAKLNVGGVFNIDFKNDKINEESIKVKDEQISKVIELIGKVKKQIKIKDIMSETEVSKKIDWDIKNYPSSSVWNDTDKIFLDIESNGPPKKKKSEKEGKKILEGMFEYTKDYCNPYFFNGNMSLYTNDYLEKYLLRTDIKKGTVRIKPDDVLILIRNKKELKHLNKNEYEGLDFKILIKEADETDINLWNTLETKAQKWIQSLRQINQVKNYNGFIKYEIEKGLINKDIATVDEHLLLNIYGYINANKSSVPGECSICSLYNEKTECSIPKNHYTFNKDVFCVLLKHNELTNKLELPQKINEDNEYNVEGSYYFITKSNYTNIDEYIISFDYFDKVFGEELINYCIIQDKLQQKYIDKKIKNERKISNNIDVEKNKTKNNDLNKKFNDSKRLSNRIGSISSLVNVGKFITKNLLLTSCSCPFIINNVDATVKMLQDINFKSMGEYTDDENTFRKSITEIPDIQKTITNPDDLEKKYNDYAVYNKDRNIYLTDTQWEKIVKSNKEKEKENVNERRHKENINKQPKKTSAQKNKKNNNKISLGIIPKEEFNKFCQVKKEEITSSIITTEINKPQKNISKNETDSNVIFKNEWLLILLEGENITKPDGKTCKPLDYYFLIGSNGGQIYGFGDKNIPNGIQLGMSKKDLLKKIGITETFNDFFNNKIKNSMLANQNDRISNEIYMAFTYTKSYDIEYIIDFNEFKKIINAKFKETLSQELLKTLKQFYINMYYNFKKYTTENGIFNEDINEIFNLTEFNVNEYIESKDDNLIFENI
jgi:hypothetical protein